MADQSDPFRVDRSRVEIHGGVHRARDILEGPRPPASGDVHRPILDVPHGVSAGLQVSGHRMHQIQPILFPPVASVNQDDERSGAARPVVTILMRLRAIAADPVSIAAASHWFPPLRPARAGKITGNMVDPKRTRRGVRNAAAYGLHDYRGRELILVAPARDGQRAGATRSRGLRVSCAGSIAGWFRRCTTRG